MKSNSSYSTRTGILNLGPWTPKGSVNVI